MKHNQVQYALDANVLMTAHHDYYAPDLCPGFWECLAYYLQAGRLLIPDRVRDEVLSPPELVNWVDRVCSSAFVSTQTPPVVAAYVQMMDWVWGNDQFSPAARDEFARVADGWLAAYARVNGAIVVTNEVSTPNVKKRVPLPNLCNQFRIRCVNTYDMLRELVSSFEWGNP